MENVICNLCHSSDQRVVYSKPDELFCTDDWFTVVECVNCGLGFVNPRPTRAEMARYYPPGYYEYTLRERAYHERRYRRQAEVLQAVTPPESGRLLLDIGCANGNFPRRSEEHT